MADDDVYTRAQTFTALHTVLMSMESVDDFLQDLAELAAEVRSPAKASCGITVEYDNRPLTVSSSDGLARVLDESQYQEGYGPCLQAMHTGEVVRILDTEAETRWPRFVERARGQGMRSSLSLPLIVRGLSVGAVNFYSPSPQSFQGEVRQRADLFAAQASTALLLAVRQIQQTVTNRQLEAALTSRSVIDQAMGIIMAQQKCSAEAAFDLLRANSQNTNRRLRDVATGVVSRATAPE